MSWMLREDYNWYFSLYSFMMVVVFEWTLVKQQRRSMNQLLAKLNLFVMGPGCRSKADEARTGLTAGDGACVAFVSVWGEGAGKGV